MTNVTKSRLRPIITSSAIYILILISLYAFVGNPVAKYSQKLKIQFRVKSDKLKESNDLIKALPNPEKAIQDIEGKIRELKDKAVTKEQIPRIIRQLTVKTRELNINIISIRPREDIKSEIEKLPVGVDKVYIDISLSAPYVKVADYLKALTEMPIIFTIEKISLEKNESMAKKEEILANILIGTYTILKIS